MDKQKTALLMTGATALLTAAYYLYSSRSETKLAPVQPGNQPEEEKKEESECPELVDAFFTDPYYETKKYLSKIEAENRSQVVSDVSYTMILGLPKGGKTFNGKITIDYTLNKVSPAYVEGGENNSMCFFIDYKGKQIRSITVNGSLLSPADTPNFWINHRIYIPQANQSVGVNRTIIEFESAYVTDCEGFQAFKDETDGSEYIYTELEPDYCHIVFPCFD